MTAPHTPVGVGAPDPASTGLHPRPPATCSPAPAGGRDRTPATREYQDAVFAAYPCLRRVAGWEWTLKHHPSHPELVITQIRLGGSATRLIIARGRASVIELDAWGKTLTRTPCSVHDAVGRVAP